FILAVEGAIKIGFRRPLNIIADDEVQVAILVVVHPSGAGAEFFWSEQSCSLRDIGERAVAIVMKKAALADGSDEKIVVAFVVVINERSAGSHGVRQEFLAGRAIVVGETNPGGLRDVAELNRGGFRRRSYSCFSGENHGQGKN